MKRISKMLLVASVLFIGFSCSKTEESMVDCTFESAYSQIHNSTDATNPKLMNYSIEYTGSGTLQNVTWTFGDGGTGAGAVVTHTYAAAGSYEAVATVTVKKDGSECTTTKKRTVTVN
ncbi:PKD domain-containing protein [Flavobacterium cutihirudinis]|uniref:PKD domain-containing protein n=1 Tax=Flavobacterium cutihirudinis TaxID=1265740 RepID=A0A3D9FV82_9FLAO|nr:PKD domain-containing protein [Flavobacterium cutihirudinis]RED24695.1 PKD domain-containing protein [Flavobacterium cutihirudinis]